MFIRGTLGLSYQLGRLCGTPSIVRTRIRSTQQRNLSVVSFCVHKLPCVHVIYTLHTLRLFSSIHVCTKIMKVLLIQRRDKAKVPQNYYLIDIDDHLDCTDTGMCLPSGRQMKEKPCFTMRLLAHDFR